MKKIRSEFLTEKEANLAMDKINPYCGDLKIVYGGETNRSYNESFFDFPEMNALSFGSFGMTANWHFSPYSLEDKYTRTFSNITSNPSGRAVLEADVAEDNFEYVKDKLYSLGAITVV